MPRLDNQRHERFAQALFEGETADAAYVKAGFKANRGNASRLKANENILARVSELQNAMAKSTEISVASICKELDQANEIAKANGQASAMVSASTLRAKLAGLLTEKVQVETVNDPFAEDKTIEDIGARMARDLADGVELTDEQRVEFAELLVEWVTTISEYLAGCAAKPVKSRSGAC